MLDRPRSPAGDAVSAFYAERNGRSPDQRRRFRARLLDVTLDDLRRIAKDYLTADKLQTAVITDPGKLDVINELGLKEVQI